MDTRETWGRNEISSRFQPGWQVPPIMVDVCANDGGHAEAETVIQEGLPKRGDCPAKMSATRQISGRQAFQNRIAQTGSVLTLSGKERWDGVTARELTGEGSTGSDRGRFNLHPEGDRSHWGTNLFYRLKKASLAEGTEAELQTKSWGSKLRIKKARGKRCEGKRVSRPGRVGKEGKGNRRV